MTRDEVKQYEQQFSRKSYKEIDEAMKTLSSDDLLDLLDSKSIKIGDTAASLLSRRNEMAAIISRVLNNRVRTEFGRLRASSVLEREGVGCPEAGKVYEFLLNDRSDDVVSNALFGVVFMRRREILPKLRNLAESFDVASRRRRRLGEAIAALEADDPFIFSPNFHDSGDVWGLDKQRFGKRIGKR